MTRLPRELELLDWRLTTWDGSRREQLRRWAALPLDQIIAAIEEMEELTRELHDAPPADVVPRHQTKSRKTT